ncbi:hypothetical protein ACERII_10280 [Evansella sp. AB-rgal1]|uniref:hypothetical protein n=1 Tax=Evansella sp. AB-rgal1 TaxID=3242696 RepID=UPI00359DDBC1
MLPIRQIVSIQAVIVSIHAIIVRKPTLIVSIYCTIVSFAIYLVYRNPGIVQKLVQTVRLSVKTYKNKLKEASGTALGVST